MSDYDNFVTQEEFERANVRGQRALQRGPRALAARYEAGKIVVELDTGLEIRFVPNAAQGLEQGTPEQLSDICIEQQGLGLHWPQLDADLYVPSLIHGLLGSRRWMKQIASLGGKVSTPKKAMSARENGKKGGRPRKVALA